MKKVPVVFIFISLFFVTVNALTISQCYTDAHDNYPLISKYGLIEKSKAYSVSNANKGYLPSVSVNLQASWQNSVAEFPANLASKFSQMGVDLGGLNKDQYRVAIELYQTIWDGGDIKAKKANIDAQNRVANLSTDIEMYAVRERINNIYFGILLIERQLAQNMKLIETLESNCAKINALIKNGVATESDLALLDAERLTAMQNRSSLKATEEAYRKMLAIFINRSIDDEKLQQPEMFDYKNVSCMRPELQLFKAQKDLAYSELKTINSSLMPKIGAFAQGYYGYPGYNMFEDMIRDRWSINFIVGLKVQWNIGGLYRKSNNIKSIKQRQDEIDVNTSVFTFNNNLQVVNKQNEIDRIKMIMLDDDKIIELRNKIRLASEAKLLNGVTDVNDLLQDITKEDQAKILKEYHEIELLKNIYDLKFLLNN